MKPKFIKRLKDLFFVAAVGIDSKENLYLLDLENFSVKKYNTKGEFLLCFGAKGSGPGEFTYPNSMFVRQDTVIVIDAPSKSINKFNLNGKFISKIILKQMFSNIKKIDNNTYMGFAETGFMKKDGYYITRKFVLLDHNFKIKKILHKNTNKYSSNRNFIDLFYPYISSKKNIFISANNDNEYKIKVYNLAGELQYLMTKNYRSKKISKEEISDFDQMLNKINKKSVPDKLDAQYKKSINGLFYTKKNHLLSKVSLDRNKNNKNLFVVDVFDDSVYIGRDTLKNFIGRDFIDRVYEPIFIGNKILYNNLVDGYIDIYEY